MANLSVNSKILRYKETSYQISQIASAKPTIKKMLKPEKHFDPKSIGLPIKISLGTIGLGVVLAMAGTFYAFWPILIGVCFAMYSLHLYAYNERQKDAIENRDPYSYLHGISLRMSNGDSPVFWSPNEKMIKRIHHGILDAMGGDENVSIIFRDVNIEISDSENVNIGNNNEDE